MALLKCNFELHKVLLYVKFFVKSTFCSYYLFFVKINKTFPKNLYEKTFFLTDFENSPKIVLFQRRVSMLHSSII